MSRDKRPCFFSFLVFEKPEFRDEKVFPSNVFKPGLREILGKFTLFTKNRLLPMENFGDQKEFVLFYNTVM